MSTWVRRTRFYLLALAAVAVVYATTRSVAVTATSHPLLSAMRRGSDLLDDDGSLVKQFGHRIIHQSWKSATLPSGSIAAFCASWPRYHSGALHVLWTDEDNLRLVHRHYPQHEELYRGLQLDVMRSDVARLMYLHQYGGLYADMDYEARADVFESLPGNKDV